MSSQPRKRAPAEQEPTTSLATSETSPIASNNDSSARDYNSIAPSLPRRSKSSTSANNASDAPQDGTTGALERPDDQRRASAEREAVAVERQDRSRWRGFWEKYGSVELENKGSVARDHLALERTFLAWLRTSLSFASIGIAITQLFRLNSSLASSPKNNNNNHAHHNQLREENALASSTAAAAAYNASQARLRHLGKPLGATFIGISIVMLFIGFHRYFEAQHYVIRGKFPASRGSILVVSVITGALIVSSLVVIVVTAPSAFES